MRHHPGCLQKSPCVGQQRRKIDFLAGLPRRDITEVGSRRCSKRRFRYQARVAGFAQRQHRPPRTQCLDSHAAGPNHERGARQPAGYIGSETDNLHSHPKFGLQLRQCRFARCRQMLQLAPNQRYSQRRKLAQQHRKHQCQQGRRPLAFAPIEAADKCEPGRLARCRVKRSTEGYAVGYGRNFGSRHSYLRYEMLTQIFADGNDPVAIHINQRGGRVQVLAAVHGAYQRHFQPPQCQVTHPTSRPGVAMHDVDAFAPHQLPNKQGIAQPLAVAAVADGCSHLGSSGRQLVGVR